jgi:predicted ATPase/DNA-binding SARP family transcriptional activator
MVTYQHRLLVPPNGVTCDDAGVTALGVLGPLVLRGPEGPVRLGSTRQRRLLAALAAHLGRPVDVGLLVELVWGADPPADPAGAVQTNVARLRRLLPPGLRLVTTPDGCYRLEAERSAVDVAAFADHLAAAAPGAPARLDRLVAALALWRGRPFCELDHPSLEPEVARLDALRATAAEQHAEALLAVGRPGEAVAAAEALVAAEPLRESAVGVLMRALVAAGRQGDALAAFGRLRRLLADDLGLDPCPELRALEQRVLRQELPGPAVPDPPAARAPWSPPLPVSSFVGRRVDLDRVVEHLRRCRVVTLCGPGGVGKTRLALHAAATVARRYADGVTFVAFGDGAATDVAPLLAAALRLADGPGGTGAPPPRLVDRIVEVLADARRLLVLDNCEHVPDEVAPILEAVTAAAPGVDVLVTSREPLRVDGEQVLPVAPLDPAAAALLLHDRIRAGDPTDPPAPDDALVAEVCRRLDGLPLALELAAARARSLGLRGLRDALADEPAGGAYAVLRTGRRTAAPRHRSLHDVVAWSHGLLDERQRTLFERLSVFAGPVERTAVVAVCGDADALPDLVDRSLVVRVEGEPARFGMLETLRAFGRSRLAADPGGPALRARHATWAARLADEVTAARRGPGEAAAIRRFDAHLADLRRAHAWLCENGPVDELLRLTVPVAELSYLRSRADLVLLLEDTLRQVGLPVAGPTGGPAHPLVARLLGYHAHTLWQRGDLDGAQEQARRAMAVAARAGDPTAARDAHEALANALSFRGDLDGAQHEAGIALALARAAGDPDGALTALGDLAIQSAYAGDHAASRCHEAAMDEVVTRTGSVSGRALLAYVRGECRAERGDADAASHLRAAVAVAEGADLWFLAGIARHTLLTSAARTATDPATALSSIGALLEHWHAHGAWTQLWIAMRALIETLSRLGRHRDVATLLGALAGSRRATYVFGADSARVEEVERAARAALGPAFDRLRADGAALGDAGAVDAARRLTGAGARAGTAAGSS